MMTFITSATRVWRLLSRVDALPPACSQPLRLVSRSHGCFFYPRLVLLALARILPNPGRYVHHRRYRLNLEPLPWPVPYRPSDTEGLGNPRFRGSGENQGFPGQGRDLKLWTSHFGDFFSLCGLDLGIFYFLFRARLFAFWLNLRRLRLFLFFSIHRLRLDPDLHGLAFWNQINRNVLVAVVRPLGLVHQFPNILFGFDFSLGQPHAFF